ncbi:MAG: LPS export ABC transporter permease LptG [candidate division Zixibacteria bacterium]|nr:LPS export ABC transporter permease LptG [candidate division Zixibacteria bacterium]
MRVGPRILDRYLSTEFFRMWLVALFAFIAIFLVVNLFEKVSKFLEYDVPLGIIVKYYLFMIPYIVKWINPIAVLLGVLFSLGTLSRNLEITAMTAAGLSLRRVMFPVILLGFIISAGVFAFGETVVPYADTQKTEIETVYVKRLPLLKTIRRINLAYRGRGGRFYYVRVFDGIRNQMRDVRVVEKSEAGELRRLIVAREAVWRGDRWQFRDGSVRTFRGGGEIKVSYFDKKYFDVPETPADFMREDKDAETMKFDELATQISNLESSGVDATKERVELYLKISVPLANFIVIFLGAPLALQSHRAGLAYGFGLAILLGFMLWGALAVGRAFGQNGTLPPLVAAFLPDTLFGLLGLAMLYRART